MSRVSVKQDASKTNRSLVDAAADRECFASERSRRKRQADPVLKFWRWTIYSAESDAKRTHNGLPTYNACIARLWIERSAPAKSDRENWPNSFACACSWLGLDVDTERARVLKRVDQALDSAYVAHMRQLAYERRAMLLSAIGEIRTLGKQHVLPFVTERDIAQAMELDFPDPANAFKNFVGLQAA